VQFDRRAVDRPTTSPGLPWKYRLLILNLWQLNFRLSFSEKNMVNK